MKLEVLSLARHCYPIAWALVCAAGLVFSLVPTGAAAQIPCHGQTVHPSASEAAIAEPSAGERSAIGPVELQSAGAACAKLWCTPEPSCLHCSSAELDSAIWRRAIAAIAVGISAFEPAAPARARSTPSIGSGAFRPPIERYNAGVNLYDRVPRIRV